MIRDLWIPAFAGMTRTYMASTKELKQRIKGIKGTGKITRAMEMISAVKMRKAVAKVIAIRPYAEAALGVFAEVSRAVHSDNEERNEDALFQDQPLNSVLFVVITSNRGLCGSFNAQVMREVRREIERLLAGERKPDRIDFLSLGKKGDQLLRRFEGGIKASFPDVLTSVRADATRPVANMIREEFESGRYGKVMLIYTDYVSPMTQKTRSRRLLPLSKGALSDEVSEMDHSDRMMYEARSTVNDEHVSATPSSISREYVIEPTPEEVLKTLIPRLIEIQLFHAILESNASQEAARMMAMRNATDAAKDMVADFTLTYNQLRQAKVTQEIAELSAGMAAVSG